MTQGELAMLLAPREETTAIRLRLLRAGKKPHAYAGALQWCAARGLLPADAKPDAPVTALPKELFAPVRDVSRRSVYRAYRGSGRQT